MYSQRIALDDNAMYSIQFRAALEVFYKVKALYPNAVIAGGAPRDWLLREPARDVDIFVYEPSWERLQPAVIKERLEEILGIALGLKGTPEYDVPRERQGLLYVFEGVFHWGVFGLSGVQIIVHNIPVNEVYKSFPTSLSRYWIERGPIVYYSLLAWLGVFNRKIYCRDIEFTEKQRQYLMKIWRKVPEYAVVTDNEGYIDAEREGINTQRGNLDGGEVFLIH
jgi:hypothetical protein